MIMIKVLSIAAIACTISIGSFADTNITSGANNAKVQVANAQMTLTALETNNKLLQKQVKSLKELNSKIGELIKLEESHSNAINTQGQYLVSLYRIIFAKCKNIRNTNVVHR